MIYFYTMGSSMLHKSPNNGFVTVNNNCYPLQDNNCDIYLILRLLYNLFQI